MTDNELLEKLYEGTLTSQENQLLDVRIAQSPEFAAEVQEFLAVVQLLHNEKNEDRTDTAFLDTTREKVLALVATAGAAGIAGGGAAVQSGGTSILTAKFLQWAFIALGTLGAGGVVWNLVTDTPERTVQEMPAAEPLAPAPSEQAVEQPVVQDQIMAENPVQAPSPEVRETPPPARQAKADREITQPDRSRPASQPADQTQQIQKPDTPDQPNVALAESSVPPPDDVMVSKQEQHESYEKELQHFNQRLRQLRALKDVPGQARVLAEIAGTERLMQKYDAAVVHADQSLQLWKQLGDAAGTVSAYQMLGASHRDAGNIQKAESVLSSGLNMAQGEMLKEQRGLLLGELAKVYEAQGNKRLAYEKMNAAVVLLRQADSPALRAWEAELKRMELLLK